MMLFYDATWMRKELEKFERENEIWREGLSINKDQEEFMGQYDPEEDTNPKKQFGALKAPFGFTPDTALIELEAVMAGGAHKYGAFNFRDSVIDAMTYIGAVHRHFALWKDGEDTDPESGRSHLAHIMACCALALDAMHTGKFEDNRSKTGLVSRLLKECAESHNQFAEEYDSRVLEAPKEPIPSLANIPKGFMNTDDLMQRPQTIRDLPIAFDRCYNSGGSKDV